MNMQTILIGLDGATFSILDPLMDEGGMPFLKEFITSGARAELCSVIPPLTPPAWTSLVTGRSPGQHGVFDFFRKEAPDSHHIRFMTSRDVGCETIWEMVDRHEMRATVLNFPLTFPPPQINGHVVPGGWMPWRQLRLGCHPAGLYDRLKALPGFNPRELAMDMSHEEKVLEGCQRDEYKDWIALHIRRERQWFNVLRYLMQEDPTELTAILFDGVDKLQHLCWRFLDPAYDGELKLPWEQRVRAQSLEYFRQLDKLLAEIVELAGPEATVVFASDHGFGSQVRTFFVNAWLEQRGYLAWADGKGPRASDAEMLGMGQLARHVYLLDWEHTKAYAPMPSGNGIHIVRADEDHPHGVPDTEYELFRDRLIEQLCALKDPFSGEPVVSRVWKHEDAFAGPYLELAPDLTLELQDGGLVSILASETPVSPRSEPSGTHRPKGIFIARGPGIRQGVQLSALSILDVAPLVLYSLGLPVPEDMEGRLPTETLEPAALQARPVETVVTPESATVEPSHTPGGPVLDEEAEAEILKRLRALGYVE
jgi:predicted AlkP superfamily phosphohydrolase/phosphomutase